MLPRFALYVCLSICLFSSCSAQTPSINNQASPAEGQHQFDGPAELPRLHVASSMADTPAHGRTIQVKEGDDLQAAIDAAKCGDVLSLRAGATFEGLFRFPNKPCDDSHWIIVRTSAPDSLLPPEGTRMTPCYAAVASLPGRPDYHCTSPRNVLAKLVLNRNAVGGPILFLEAANHYRFLGLEITRELPEVHMRNLVQPAEPETTANHLIFDRLWLHGGPQDETKDGIHLSGTTYVAIIDSYFSDFKCIAGKGSCTDAQAINGGTFDQPGGPYKIENNFLEASGQSIMFGGARGSTTPADIEIRHNYLFKPMIWKPGEPGFVGGYTGNPFIVKNNFELKNAERLLLEGNVLENCWGGFTQQGFSIVLAPGNQGGRCPSCHVTDITIRYNKIIRVGSAIAIANVAPKQYMAFAGERYSIHDLLVEDIEGQAFKGFGLFAIILSKMPPLKDVRIDHITAFPQRAIFTIMSDDKVSGFSLTNSIFDAGQFGIRSAGGGPKNCAAGIRPNEVSTVLDSCFSKPKFSNNLIIGGLGNWPEHNLLVNDTRAAGLWGARNDSEENYRVCTMKDEAKSCKKISPAHGGATDGKDIGADTKAIEEATRDIL